MVYIVGIEDYSIQGGVLLFLLKVLLQFASSMKC